MAVVPECIDEHAHEWFVQLSRDTSPLHVDAAHARRGPVGDRVVHGAHIVLASLEVLAREGLRGWGQVAASFRNPLTIGQPFRVEWAGPGDGLHFAARAIGGEVVLADLSLRHGTREWWRSAGVDSIDTHLAEMVAPGDAWGAAGREPLAIDATLLAQRAPGVPPGLAAALCAASRVAGMRCPGRLALLRGFDLAPGAAGDEVAWSTTRVRDALRLIIVGLSGAVDGSVEVAMRHAPVEQPTLTQLASVVAPGEFRGMRAVVLGGTRGLGLLAARALTAGGAHVVATGRVGGDTIDDIPCERFDIADADPAAVERLRAFSPTHLLHFATPPIPRRLGRGWSDEVYDAYARVYEGGLALAAAIADGPLDVLYPSTVFIDDRPTGFDEYIAAKEASERAAADLAVGPDAISVMVERLPVLATDQTAGATSAAPEDNIDIIVPLLRAFAGRRT